MNLTKFQRDANGKKIRHKKVSKSKVEAKLKAKGMFY